MPPATPTKRVETSPTAMLLADLADLTPLVERLRSEGLRRRGLTLPRLRLVLLLSLTGPQRSTELAARLGVTPRAITGLVDGLLESGLVTREPDPTDRRAAIIDLTPAGTAVTVDVRASQDELAAYLLSEASVEEIEAAIATLASFRRAIERRLEATAE